jgi:hypothetical protein
MMGATTLLVQPGNDIISHSKTTNEDSRDGKKQRRNRSKERKRNTRAQLVLWPALTLWELARPRNDKRFLRLRKATERKNGLGVV